MRLSEVVIDRIARVTPTQRNRDAEDNPAKSADRIDGVPVEAIASSPEQGSGEEQDWKNEPLH